MAKESDQFSAQLSEAIVQTEPPAQQTHEAAVVLNIVKPGAKWREGLIEEVAKNIGGLVWSDHERRLELPGNIKSEPVAVLSYDVTAAQIGDGVSSLQLTLDPASCSLHHCAFSDMVSSAKKMADVLRAEALIEGDIQISDAWQKAETKRVQRIQESRKAAVMKSEPQADGTVKLRGPLSFLSETRTPKGKWLGWDHFDVPALSYYDGEAKGLEHMLELLDAIAARRQTFDLRIDHALEKAFVLAASQDVIERYKDVHASNVAAGFVETVSDALIFFARHAGYKRYIQARIEDVRRNAARDADEKQQRAAKFVARMKAARKGNGVSAKAKPGRRGSRAE